MTGSADIQLSHEANMVKKFNSDTWSEKYFCAFTWKVFVSHYIIGSNTKSRTDKWIYFSSLSKIIFAYCCQSYCTVALPMVIPIVKKVIETSASRRYFEHKTTIPRSAFEIISTL